MTDKIKVWVPVRNKVIYWGLMDEDDTEESCWRCLQRGALEDRKTMEAQGWTVQPYTLVKGHDHD